MPLDTIETLIGRVRQRVGTLPDYFLIQDWIVSGYRDVMNRIPWTWRRKQAQFLFYATYSTGTASINRGESLASFVGATLTIDMVGRQIRIGGTSYSIRTITGFLDSTHVYLDDNWADETLSGASFEIFQAYQVVPDDFESFISIVDVRRSMQIDWWSGTAEMLDRQDTRRAYSGSIAYYAVLKDYSSDSQGVVSDIIQSKGVGSKPSAGGSYTGVSDAVMTIEMTSASVFKWKKDSQGIAGAYTTGVAIDATGSPQNLADGVQIQFPSTAIYTSGDVFSVSCKPANNPGLPRYEFWPHIKADESRSCLYLSKMPDLTDDGAVLPRYVRGDILVELALAQCARWKIEGNNYYDLKLAAQHDVRAESMLIDLEREDQARETTDLVYSSWSDMPVYDSAYLANHDIGYEISLLD